MEDDRARLEEDFAKTLQDLSEELTSVPIRKLTNLYTKISNKEAEKIRKDDDSADCLFQKLEDMKELDPTNVDGLIKNLQYIKSMKAADILKSFKTRNKNLIKKEIERRKQEKQPVASSASSSTAKSPPSQKGDRTEEQPVAISASSSTAKSPPSQKGDGTEKQPVASSASSSTAKFPPSQKGDGTDFLFVSFSSKNREEVTKLVSKIESVFGVDSCWMYTRRNLPGDYTLDSITAAIKKADIMLCMITQDYIDSKICMSEFNLAEASKKLIIPLHLEDVGVPYETTNGGAPGTQLEATKLVYARMYIDDPEPEFRKVIKKMKKYLHGKDANASGSPSTAGSQKRKSSHDGDDSEAKVPRKE